MKDMQRIVDFTWAPWTYASIISLAVGVWAGNRFLTEGDYGGLVFNGGAFMLGAVLAFVAVSPLVLAFYVARRMVDNQVELGSRLAGAGLAGPGLSGATEVGPGAASRAASGPASGPASGAVDEQER